jgi:hypothetical protein
MDFCLVVLLTTRTLVIIIIIIDSVIRMDWKFLGKLSTRRKFLNHRMNDEMTKLYY